MPCTLILFLSNQIKIPLQVQNLIERCLQLYMNKGEVVRTLSNRARIEPGFTTLGEVFLHSILQFVNIYSTVNCISGLATSLDLYNYVDRGHLVLFASWHSMIC